MANPKGTSKYSAALHSLNLRISRWEAMSHEEIRHEHDAMEAELRVTTQGQLVRTADGKVTPKGGGIFSMKIGLSCIEGLPPDSDSQRINPLAMTDRIIKQQARARKAQEVKAICDDAFSRQGSKTAEARWSRLDSVKEWAFEQRRNDQKSSRAAVIRAIKDEVRARARVAGETLSGDDLSLIPTITRWFRVAGIK